MESPRAHHIVLTTHNSRTSQRMISRNIQKGPPIKLNLEEEIALTKIIGAVIKESGYKVLAYNICVDHVHLALVCYETDLTKQIQKLKSISSKNFHRQVAISSHSPELHKGHLWSQKFYYCHLDEYSLESLSRKPSEVFSESHLARTTRYIERNREKHGLEISMELKTLINSFVVNIDEAYASDRQIYVDPRGYNPLE